MFHSWTDVVTLILILLNIQSLQQHLRLHHHGPSLVQLTLSFSQALCQSLHDFHAWCAEVPPASGCLQFCCPRPHTAVQSSDFQPEGESQF